MIRNSTDSNRRNNSQLKQFKKTQKIPRHGIGNPGTGLGQAQKYAWVKLVNWIKIQYI